MDKPAKGILVGYGGECGGDGGEQVRVIARLSLAQEGLNLAPIRS